RHRGECGPDMAEQGEEHGHDHEAPGREPVAEALAPVELLSLALERLLQDPLGTGVHLTCQIGHPCNTPSFRRMSYLLGSPTDRLEEHNESSRTEGLHKMYRKLGRTVAAGFTAAIACAAF